MATTTSERPGRLGIGVVGAGRVGSVLGSCLRQAGHAVVGVSAVSQASRERAELLLPSVPVLEVREVVERSELVLLAVPDDVLPDVVSGLAELSAWQPGQLVLHTSRHHGLSVLDPALRRGAIPLVVTPVTTLSGFGMDVPRVQGATFAVTAPGPVVPIGQALVVEMGGEPMVVEDDARPLFFAAVSHVSDHLATLICQAEEVLGRAGVTRPDLVVGPLARAALDDAVDRGDAALRGPAVDGAREAVDAHRRALAADATRSGSAEILASYLALARASAERAVDLGRLSPSAAERLLDVLADS